jgi:hypothetical protein
VTEDTPLAEVERVIVKSDIGELPVVKATDGQRGLTRCIHHHYLGEFTLAVYAGTILGKAGKVLGIITRADVLRQHAYYPGLVQYQNKAFQVELEDRKFITNLIK